MTITSLSIIMSLSNCSHDRAIPAADFASAGGWYCPDCKKGCSRPAFFSPPPKSELVSTETRAAPLLTNSVPCPVEKPPNEAPLFRENEELSRDLVSKQLVSVSKHIQAQGVYEVSAKGTRYYRYVVNEGHKILESIHIRGGSISNPIAQARAEKIRRWISHGLNPSQIIPMISQWR
jgi:hypothetical protein